MRKSGTFAASAALIAAVALFCTHQPVRAANSPTSAIVAQAVTAQSAAPARAAVDPQSFFHHGLATEAMKAGRLSEAIAEYKKAAELDPLSPRLERELAAAYLAAHEPKEAVAAYRRALAIDPRDVESLYYLGLAAAAEKDYAAAQGYFHKVLESALDPASNRFCGLSLYQLAAVNDVQDRTRDAAQAFERLVQWLGAAPTITLAQPEVARLASMRPTLAAKTVQLYLRDKQPERAVEFLRQTAPEILDQPKFGASVAALLLQEKQFDPALEVARLMQRRHPDDPAPYQMLVQIYDVRKDAEGGIKALRQFAAENPKVPFIRLLLGQKLVAAGHEDEGLKLIEQVMDEPGVESQTGEGSLLPGVVRSLVEGKKFDQALKAAQLLQKKAPTEASSYLLLEQVYDKLGDNAAFITAFRQYQNDYPRIRIIALLLGKKLLAAGQTAGGLALVQPLLEADSGVSDQAREVLVAYETRSGAPEQALKLYADALTSNYKDAPAILGLSKFIDSLDEKTKPAVMAAAAPLFKNDLKKVGPAFVLGLLAESYDSVLAADCFQRAIDAQPRFAVAYERRSAMLIQQDRLMEALDTLRQALDNGMSFGGAFYRRIGAVYEMVDRDPDAIAAYRAALRIDPDESSPRERLPRILVRIGQADKARAMLHEAVTSRPDDPRSYADLAIFESDVDNARTALATVERALSRLPGSRELLIQKVVLQRKVRDTVGALKTAEQLAALPDSERVAAELRYGVYLDLKQYDKAENIVRKLKAEHPDDPDVDYLLAGLYTQQGDDRKAEEVLAGILKGHPRDSGANNDLGFMRADRGERLAESERMIRIALQENPESSAYLDSLGWVLYKQKKLDEALVYLRRAVRLDPQIDPVVWEHLGDAMVRTGHQDTAGPIYEQARTMLKNPDRLAERDDAEVVKRLDQKLKALKDGKEVPVAPYGSGIK